MGAELDWGDGSYEHTGAMLVAASEVAADAATIVQRERVLDLGCGTGNAALAAARRGAKVLAVDPSERLASVARERARAEGLTIEVVVGDASQIPAADGSQDALLSVFAVIFAPDAEQAASEMMRVVRPGGRLVVTTWVPRGPMAEAGKIVRDALMSVEPPPPSAAPPPPPWGDPNRIRALFESRGGQVDIVEKTIVFEADSAEAWVADLEENHPFWRSVRARVASRPEVWTSVRERTLECLRAGNQSSNSLRVLSEYLVVTVTR